jgi:hypothetical protein
MKLLSEARGGEAPTWLRLGQTLQRRELKKYTTEKNLTCMVAFHFFNNFLFWAIYRTVLILEHF